MTESGKGYRDESVIKEITPMMTYTHIAVRSYRRSKLYGLIATPSYSLFHRSVMLKLQAFALRRQW